jgi:hypothetical protein
MRKTDARNENEKGSYPSFGAEPDSEEIESSKKQKCSQRKGKSLFK